MATTCVTSVDSPGFGWASPGQPCSGHGTCVNISATRSLCQCDLGYSGVAEWFDLRAENGLAFDCPTELGLYTGLWSVTLAFFLFRQITLLLAVVLEVFDARKAKRSLRETVSASSTVKVLLTDGLVANPLMLWAILNKIFIRDVYGTESSITVPLVLSTAIINVSFTVFTHHTFKTLMRGALLNAEPSMSIELWHKRVSIGAALSYIILTGTPSFVALGLDKSNGPLVSGEYIVILLRNIGMVVWLPFQALSGRWLLHQTISMLDSVEANRKEGLQITGGTGSSTEKSAKRQAGALKVIEYIRQHSMNQTKQAMFGCIVWTVALLPWFWPFQGYFMAIMAFPASWTSNSGLVLLRSRFRYWWETSRGMTMGKHPNQIFTTPAGNLVEDNQDELLTNTDGGPL